MSKLRPIRIRRNDRARPLITETLPFELPIIFSSSGLYDHIKNIESMSGLEKKIVERLILDSDYARHNRGTKPLRYKIRKNSTEYRRLALIHPRAQWRFSRLYGEFESLILYYCTKSEASIRAPHSIAGSFYRKGAWENLRKYKNGAVSIIAEEDKTRHTPSYFSYRGVNRLYKFFESRDYLELEKKYSHYWTLDVSKCFDSIYTHSLSWALKDKDFTKANVSVAATFAQEFDSAMQYANHKETNGIVIGPEVSRIFAEMIFQEIDRRVMARLELRSLEFGNHYAIRRYVDDVFIFSRTETQAACVYESYADVLSDFNLFANSGKAEKLKRPFATKKSRIIYKAGRSVTEFIDKFLDQSDRDRYVPKRVHSSWNLSRSFIDSIKSTCSEDESSYDDVATFLIGVLSERVKKVVVAHKVGSDACDDYLNALSILLDVMFFLYGVSPSVNSSYKLCGSMLLAIEFSKQEIPRQYPVLAQKIFDLTVVHLSEERQRDSSDIGGFLPLETLNVLLTSRELGDNYLLPEELISSIFGSGGRSSIYFRATSCLFYIKKEKKYTALRRKIGSEIEDYLSDMSDIAFSSEKAYLFLDMICCPYASDRLRKAWARKAIAALGISAPTDAELNTFVIHAATSHWQINWANVNLLNLLEKKELKQVY